MEKELIKEYGTQDSAKGYNILEGGSNPVIPDEVRVKMSISMRGNKNGLNKPCSDEKKKKISEAQKGRKLTEEHKSKLSIAKRGKKHGRASDETIQKISDGHKKKRVICTNTGIIYPSIQRCAKETKIDATAICACCKGRHKTTHGLHFEYYDDDDVIKA